MAEEFFEHLQLSTALGAKNMINPENGRIIAIGGAEYNKLLKKYENAAETKETEDLTQINATTEMMRKMYTKRESDCDEFRTKRESDCDEFRTKRESDCDEFRTKRESDCDERRERRESATPEAQQSTLTAKFKKAAKASKQEMKAQFLANPYINPKTGRAIKKGSTAFNSLIKEFGLPTEF
jgi:hypothetical protein